jgi:hypothetical protein
VWHGFVSDEFELSYVSFLMVLQMSLPSLVIQKLGTSFTKRTQKNVSSDPSNYDFGMGPYVFSEGTMLHFLFILMLISNSTTAHIADIKFLFMCTFSVLILNSTHSLTIYRSHLPSFYPTVHLKECEHFKGRESYRCFLRTVVVIAD